MSEVPRLRGEQTLALAREGHACIGRRARQLRSDVFRGRLLGQRVTFLTGRDAAELFYDEAHFRRAAATPWLVQKALFGERPAS
jgi:fatty-acid peroxygenase